MQQVPGVALGDLSMDCDHNRMVVSLLGSSAGLQQAVLQLFEIAEQHIDLTLHSGVHPRIGAVDVVPFVPLASTTMEQARELAWETAQKVARRFPLPILLYEESARKPEHRNLPDLRKVGLQERLLQSPPDLGPVQLHPRLGATVMGARRPLVAFNVLLDSQNLEAGKEIARQMRRMPGVRSLGLYLKSIDKVQISMNLTDPEETDLHQAFARVEELARPLGIEIVSSELIGMAPAHSFLKMARHHLRLQRAEPGQILEWNFLHQEALCTS